MDFITIELLNRGQQTLEAQKVLAVGFAVKDDVVQVDVFGLIWDYL